MCGSWYRERKVISDKKPWLPSSTISKPWHACVALLEMVIQIDDDLPFLALAELTIFPSMHVPPHAMHRACTTDL